MLEYLKKRMDYRSGLETDDLAVLSIAADIEITDIEQIPMQTNIHGVHPKFGNCTAVIRISGPCYILWSRVAPGAAIAALLAEFPAFERRFA